jgi:hypothetical protein
MSDHIQRLFNEALPAAMARRPETAAGIGATYQFNVTGEGGGEWFIDASDSGPRVEPGAQGTAQCVLTIGARDFEALYEDPRNNAMPLYLQQKLTVTGNVMLAMRLQQLFELVARQ